jgi:hypothetical protein
MVWIWSWKATYMYKMSLESAPSTMVMQQAYTLQALDWGVMQVRLLRGRLKI